MGILFPCFKVSDRFADERVPLRSSRRSSISPNKRTVISGANLYRNESDLFSVDPEIQKFLEDFSSNDDDVGHMDEQFEQEILDERN